MLLVPIRSFISGCSGLDQQNCLSNLPIRQHCSSQLGATLADTTPGAVGGMRLLRRCALPANGPELHSLEAAMDHERMWSEGSHEPFRGSCRCCSIRFESAALRCQAKRWVIVQPQWGLCNRLRAVASGPACRDSNRAPGFSHLCQSPGACSPNTSLEVSLLTGSRCPAATVRGIAGTSAVAKLRLEVRF